MTITQPNKTIDDKTLREKIIGCWLGKAVGGTLGGPFEGVRKTLDLTYYDPIPTEMLPNDDLDLQVVYAFLLDQMDTPRVDRNILSKAWAHIGMSPDEYGIAKRNLALGLTPPTTGAYDNPFTRGMGAAIRSELWACLAPGDPDTAARFAYEDACMDHAGEGIYAAQFNAALESMAFVERNREVLLDSALKFIPQDSELYSAITDTRQWFCESGDWKQTQKKLADKYLGDNFTDVVINHAYIVLGWLAGKDFGQAICIAVNCGQDTDCTGATLGALLGIIDPDSIDEKWLKPIGRDLVLSDCITGVEHPQTLDGFTDLVIDLRKQLDDTTPPVPDQLEETGHLAITAKLGFADHMPDGDSKPQLPATASTVRFAGNWVQLDPEQVQGAVAVVQYEAEIDKPLPVQLMFASPQPVKVWLDGQLVINSPGGEFVPAPHRTRPQACSYEGEIAADKHTITAAIQCDKENKKSQWAVGLFDTKPKRPVDRNWLVDPLRR